MGLNGPVKEHSGEVLMGTLGWTGNFPITRIGRDSFMDHVRGIYNVLARIQQKYPDVPMMLLFGRGARCDYEALKYFTEFWCSDNTDLSGNQSDARCEIQLCPE